MPAVTAAAGVELSVRTRRAFVLFASVDDPVPLRSALAPFTPLTGPLPVGDDVFDLDPSCASADWSVAQTKPVCTL